MRGGGDASAHEDALLSRVYQQISETREPYFAAEYDLRTGMDRYQAWLAGQTEVAASVPAADVTMPLRVVVTGPGEWNPELAVIELYSVQYKSLVRLAAMLVRDTSTAEEVVQDAFIAMHDGWHRLKDADKALAYLRQAVVNRSRSVLRHRMVVEKNAPKPAPDMPSAEHGALTLLERSAVIAALRDLPARQREAIVLRYYADLSEAEIAATMRISRGAVKSHTARAMASLKAALEQDA
jgi:RNA polymerase sigma-70 factor (sigma-E family)